jgi:hypothetical protein
LAINTATFERDGGNAMLSELRKLVQKYKIPEPDWFTLPANVNPSILCLWDWPARKAQVFIYMRRTWKEDSPGFRDAAFKHLRGGDPNRIEFLAEKREFFIAAAKRFSDACWESIEARVRDEHDAEVISFRRRCADERAASEQRLQLEGYGRTELPREFNVGEFVSHVPKELHLPGCCGECCNGLPDHLKTDTSLGTAPAPVSDFNDGPTSPEGLEVLKTAEAAIARARGEE